MPAWEKQKPQLYDVVSGFFPETSPKETWATNPRPLLVCGVAQDDDTGTYFCRIAYGTSQLGNGSHEDDLVIGNLTLLDLIELKKPTRFVIGSGSQMVIMPWTAEFFRPWKGKETPFISRLPEDVQRHVGHVLANLRDLPQF